jgi:signal transduction histidine kinase
MRMAAPPGDGLQQLQQACLELGSSTDPAATADAAVRWLATSAGSGASAKVFLPDRAGRLRPTASLGDPSGAGRLRSTRRRDAFERGLPVSVGLAHAPGSTLLIRPLTSAGKVGVAEIVAPTDGLEERLPAIEAVLQLVASALRIARERSSAERTIRGMDSALGLAVQLLRVKDPSAALHAATSTVHRHLRSPVVGCIPTSDAPAVTRGLTPVRRAQVRVVLEGLSAAPGAAWTLATRLGNALGAEVPVLIAAGPAILVVDGGAGAAERDFLRSVARLLAAALERIDDVALAHLRTESLDLGIAWTAHELRGPLLGASAALEHVAAGGSDARSELLRRTKDELTQLVDVVDPLLRWSAGAGGIRRRPVDLSRLVREVSASCVVDDPGRVRVDAPEGLTLRADPVQLRVAIANLVRNAIAYSGSQTPVAVSVAEHGGSVSVRVKDEGPGVPPEEREIVFDPFARGRAASRVRGGKGLGLFIARRIVEAHGGTVRLLPAARGAEFCIELPSEQPEQRSERSAS